MTIEETKQIVDKIKIYRPNFGGQFDKSGFDKLKLEWFRILEPYDYADVNRKLDEYFEDTDNTNKYPDPYYLTRYVTKSEEKKKVGVIYIKCHICNKDIERNLFDKHFDRCSSVEYICRNYKKYYNKTIDRDKLWKLSDIEFGEKYWKFCESLLQVTGMSELEKRALTNTVLTHYGHEPMYEIEEMTKVV